MAPGLYCLKNCLTVVASGRFEWSVVGSPHRIRRESRPIAPSDSVIPLDLFAGTRSYIEKVVLQVNGSYDAGMYDCCAVMCRRLLETLIIECYEAKGWQADLVAADGHYMMFSGLLSRIENEARFKIGGVR